MCAIVLARLVTIALASIVVLGGCSGSAGISSQPPLETARALAQVVITRQAQHYGNDWMYTAQHYGNDVSVYTRSGVALTWDETISGGPFSAPSGTVATPDGWWYVANGGDANVLIYKTTHDGPQGPIGVPLSDPGQIPANVDVTPSRTLVAVSNAGSASQSGSVSIYLNRGTEPSRLLTYGSDVLQGEGIAIDHQGNCFWAFNDDATHFGSIVEFSNCEGSGSVVWSGIPMVGGMAFDQSGDLYFVNQVEQGSLGNGVYQCNKTANCRRLPTIEFGHPTNLNFDHRSKDLWLSDSTGYIYAISPKNGEIESTTQAVGGPSDPPVGIAPAPGG
ncbi:MAG: hypothetical protein JOZ77_05915 [Candidatus Eremiobacteraeota bacterium]|nr:hypothetical protein [Candidatus Eremiobacteraeota bacterium]